MVQKRWLILVGCFNLCVLLPLCLVLLVSGIILKLIFAPIASVMGALLALCTGIAALRGDTKDFNPVDAMVGSFVMLLGGTFFVLERGIPWFYRERLLVEAGSNEGRERAHAASRLGRVLALSYRDERIKAALARMVEDPDAHVRKKAVQSLWPNNIQRREVEARWGSMVTEMRTDLTNCLERLPVGPVKKSPWEIGAKWLIVDESSLRPSLELLKLKRDFQATSSAEMGYVLVVSPPRKTSAGSWGYVGGHTREKRFLYEYTIRVVDWPQRRLVLCDVICSPRGETLGWTESAWLESQDEARKTIVGWLSEHRLCEK